MLEFSLFFYIRHRSIGNPKELLESKKNNYKTIKQIIWHLI